jgi:hypothetical protein
MLHISARRSRLQRCQKIEIIPGWKPVQYISRRGMERVLDILSMGNRAHPDMRWLFCTERQLANARCQTHEGFKSGMVLASETVTYPTLCLQPSNSQRKYKECIYSRSLFYFCNLYRISRSAGERELVGDYRQLDRRAITCIALHLDLNPELENGLA